MPIERAGPGDGPSPRACELQRQALIALRRFDCAFLVGGAYALARLTGVRTRPVKDLDVFVRRRDLPLALEGLARAGWSTKLAFGHWLGKAHREGEFIDLIFASGNGEIRVDDLWFEHARSGRLFDVPVAYCPPEEEIWMRSFVMERGRYDGADVVHMLRACGPTLDWRRLMHRFGPHWRVLLSHLVLFGFIYPTERRRLPRWVLDELLDRLHYEVHEDLRGHERLCQGTLLSRVEYQVDVERWGYADARLSPRGRMTEDEAREWTRAGVARRDASHLRRMEEARERCAEEGGRDLMPRVAPRLPAGRGVG
jgi:hypothetical protein